jgi:acyl carrier protein phosphodiesterase
MNFLAHLYLSCEQEELLVGNFLADYIGNKELNKFTASIQDGIVLHRKIDSYTDNHDIVKKGVRRLYASHSKYAPVIIDVLYDYFLAKNWNKYHDASLPDFAHQTYDILLKHLAIMPDRLQRVLPRMVEDNWLVGYSKKQGIAFTFDRMKRRVSKPQYLDNILESMERDFDQLDEEFNLFFPDVINYVRDECLCS